MRSARSTVVSNGVVEVQPVRTHIDAKAALETQTLAEHLRLYDGSGNLERAALVRPMHFRGEILGGEMIYSTVRSETSKSVRASWPEIVQSARRKEPAKEISREVFSARLIIGWRGQTAGAMPDERNPAEFERAHVERAVRHARESKAVAVAYVESANSLGSAVAKLERRDPADLVQAPRPLVEVARGIFASK